MSDGFKSLGRIAFLRKGAPLPDSGTRAFNANPQNVALAKRETTETSLADWFDGPPGIVLDEEIIGLGSFEHTLTVFSSDMLKDEPDEDDDEEARLIESYTPRFAYGR
jgi:hypothetical protein